MPDVLEIIRAHSRHSRQTLLFFIRVHPWLKYFSLRLLVSAGNFPHPKIHQSIAKVAPGRSG
jgi:hypothetical protein